MVEKMARRSCPDTNTQLHLDQMLRQVSGTVSGFWKRYGVKKTQGHTSYRVWLAK
jgi:hypothetical protein